MATYAESFGGIYPALLTPLRPDGTVNETVLEKLVKYEIGLGATGFYVCGSSGEAFLLSREERRWIMEIVREAAPDQRLIAQVGSINARDAGYLAQAASDMSYDAVSSVAPFYYKFSFEEIRDYYFRLAEASPLPVIVYHIPSLSGVNMGLDQIAVFLEDKRFAGIKFTSSDFFLMEQIKTAFPDKVVLNGFDEMFLSGLAMGADGGIGTTYNFMADRFVRMRQLMAEGRPQKARAVQAGVNEIIAVLLKVGALQGSKEVMEQLGFEMGGAVPPFKTLSDEDRKLIQEKVMPLL